MPLEIMFGPRHSDDFYMHYLRWFSTLPYEEGPKKEKKGWDIFNK